MEISTDISGDIRWHSVSGSIDVGALADHLRQIYKSLKNASEMDVFWDLQHADFNSVSVEDVRKFVDFVGEN
jgi:hypothetical protein